MHLLRLPRCLRLLAAGAVLLCLQAPPAAAAADPFESMNRRIHRFNLLFAAKVLRPVTDFYVRHTTEGVRYRVGNAVANLTEPLNAMSGLAAADMDLAVNAAARFGINSIIGLGGLFDAATSLGFPARPYDLGNAACSWGVPTGPYVVLPVLGPSTLRDATAMAATSAALVGTIGAEPLLALRGSGAVVTYAQAGREIERINAQSLDTYAVYRSAYLQRRASACPMDQERLLAGQDAEEE
jgi:phospholipid-binding lipoprotein MlaA